MTKKTFHYIVEAGWLFLALLPLFVYLCAARTSAGATTLEEFMTVMSTKLNFISTDNVIYTSIKGIFGYGGTFPILQDGLVLYLTYFCIVEIVHLLVDVLLFIPRIAHSWLESFLRRI